MRHLPHEVSDVQPVLDLLSIQDPTDIKVRLAVHLREGLGQTSLT